jgi:hypothetical protein
MIYPVLDQALTEPLRHGDLCRPTPSRRKNDAVAQIGWVLSGRFGGRCNVDAFDGPASAMTIGSAAIEKQFASSSSIENTRWRCFWRYGHRYCRRW